MRIEINSYDDLLSYIKRKDVDVKTAFTVAAKFLKLIPIYFEDTTKEEVINDVEIFIERFGDKHERPIFLTQEEPDEFSVKELVKNRRNDNK